jgi:hypothetical protein
MLLGLNADSKNDNSQLVQIKNIAKAPDAFEFMCSSDIKLPCGCQTPFSFEEIIESD